MIKFSYLVSERKFSEATKVFQTPGPDSSEKAVLQQPIGQKWALAKKVGQPGGFFHLLCRSLKIFLCDRTQP